MHMYTFFNYCLSSAVATTNNLVPIQFLARFVFPDSLQRCHCCLRDGDCDEPWSERVVNISAKSIDPVALL